MQLRQDWSSGRRPGRGNEKGGGSLGRALRQGRRDASTAWWEASSREDEAGLPAGTLGSTVRRRRNRGGWWADLGAVVREGGRRPALGFCSWLGSWGCRTPECREEPGKVTADPREAVPEVWCKSGGRFGGQAQIWKEEPSAEAAMAGGGAGRLVLGDGRGRGGRSWGARRLSCFRKDAGWRWTSPAVVKGAVVLQGIPVEEELRMC